jgi:hypothetical protein
MVKIGEEMSQINESVVKFRRFIEKADGGIFTPNTRKRLTGFIPISGRNRTKNQFWYDVRERVKRALIDLQLFLLNASKDNREQVINEETIRPILDALVNPTQDEDLNPIKAEIAYMMVFTGFNYLKDIVYEDMMSLSHERTIEEAIDLADYFRALFYQTENE